MRRLQCTLTLLLLPLLVTAQSIVEVEELFTNRLHPSVVAKADDSDGYKLLSLIQLKVPNAGALIDEFKEKNPDSYMIPQLYFYQAAVYFDSGNYAEAAGLFGRIRERDLYKDLQDELNFRKGYCQMRLGNRDEALRLFRKVIENNKSQFKYPSLYYCGYLYYASRDFSKAIPYFERSKMDSRYSLLSKYHIIESKFLLKDYEYVIGNGAEVYDAVENEYKPKVARIISEAYYATDKPEEAKYYFELYSLSGGEISRNDLFYSGMIHYSLNNHISAADAFSKIASSTDSIGQSAAYHLGQSYIQLKNKHKAREAFELAAASDFDPSIKEDAYFNYAKLTFDLNRDMGPFKEYMERYRSSTGKCDEIHAYMATSFLINGNYQGAIDALNEIRNQDANTLRNLQKASFFRGMQLFRAGAYSKAVENFENSIENGSYNQSLKSLAAFWMAECYYRNDRFSKSLEILNQLQKNQEFRHSSEFSVSQYNIAYDYFKLGQYETAIDAFEKYLSMPRINSSYAKEAKTRIADSYYMLNDYAKASEIYEQSAVADNFNNLYPAIQSAICYGLTGNNAKKSALLKEAVKEENRQSPLYTQAMYELGRTYVQNLDDKNAEPIFRELTTVSADSSYYFKALLELGMIEANKKDYSKALEYYKAIVAKQPVSEEGQSALAGIENIYQRENKPEEFLAYLDTIGLSSVKTPGEKESMLFNSAEQIYLSNNYKEALDVLTSFVGKYPDGPKSAHAHFYMAECYTKLNKPEKAADNYRKVMETGDGAFSEIATLKYGEISYRLERYGEAIMAYETLGNIAVLENNKIEALAGKTKSYYANKEYGTSLQNAEALLQISNLPQRYTVTAKYYAAKDYLALGEREPAIPLLKDLADNSAASEEGSEAAYLLILDAYDAGNFNDVEELTFKISEEGNTGEYWLAKSFIVLGDSYVERDNFAQAEATYNSIRENYKSKRADDIISIVNTRLSKLAVLKKEQNDEK